MTLTACRESRPAGENPFFAEWDTPFGVPPFDRIAPGHYMPAFERAMSLHREEIEAIESCGDEPTFENVIVAFDRSGEMLDRVGSVFGMICAADLNDELQAVQEQVMPLLTAHYDRILLDERLFARIKSVYDARRTLGLDAEQLRLTEKIYDDFVRAGALLDTQSKERLSAINSELTSLEVRFGNNVLAANNAFALTLTDEEELAGMSASMRTIAREKADERGLEKSWVVTLDQPSRVPFLTYSTRRDLREQLYKAYVDRCGEGCANDNRALVADFARLRSEKARLLGYSDFASYVTAAQMAGTPQAVYALLDEVWKPALERARTEADQMERIMRAEHPQDTLEAWDWWYYAERLRKRDYDLDDAMLRPYFALENVRDGIFFLSNRLYGVTFRPVAVPVYHKDCSAYEVLDVDGSHLGVLYLDFFPRASKSGGAWCGSYRGQSYDDEGNRIAPVVSIVCNFTPPTRTTPSLLTLDETQTFFHEFGHALHSLFADVKYRSLANVEGDFVELPSQIMENWATEPEMLRQYAVHYNTGEVIPDRLVERIRKSGEFNQGFATTEMIAAALIDMDVHSLSDCAGFEADEFEAEAMRRRGLIRQIAPRYRYPYFQHIFNGGYSAGYYFYIWAEVLDKDAFEAFRESGDIFDRRTAERFRRLLSRGGSADGMTLYRDFRGADPDKRAMLSARGLLPKKQAQASDTNE